MGVAGIPSRLTPALARYSDLSGYLPHSRFFLFPPLLVHNNSV